MAVRGFRGMRDDLSEIGRQLHDIASFFSPYRPPPHRDSPPPSPRPKQRPSEGGLPGVLSDLSEIEGGFRNGLSRLSGAFQGPTVHDVVSDHRLSDAKEIGVYERVLAFVRDLVKCPESWLKFQLPIDCEFHLSLNQSMHVSIIEYYTPELKSLRLSLCPAYMNEESFWMIYFALLHPTLNKHDSELLSTYQIVKSMRIMKETNYQSTAAQSQKFDSQSLPSLTEKCSSIQEDLNETWQGASIVKTISQKSIDQWSDIASSIDVFSDATKLAHDHISFKEKNVDNALVMEMYMDSLVADAQQYIHTVEASLQEEMSRHAPLYGAGLELLSMKELETFARIHEEGLRQIRTIQQLKNSSNALVGAHSLPPVHSLYSSAPIPVGVPPSVIPNGVGIHGNGHINGASGPWFGPIKEPKGSQFLYKLGV